jgi:hypothetical protein
MNFIVACVEQLDRAAQELILGDAVANRLSLILTDNVVELLVHAQSEAIFMSQPADELTSRYGRAARHRVLGQHLDEKLKFLAAEGLIQEHELGFVRTAHSIRNVAYHAGIGHESFLYALAWEYHDLACSLFVRLRRAYITTGDGDLSTTSFRFLRHVPDGSVASVSPFGLRNSGKAAIADSLGRARPPLDHSLSDALADWLLGELDDIQGALEYLVQNDPGGRDPRRLLADALQARELFGRVPISLEVGTEAFNTFISERQAEMHINWCPPFEELPLASWRGRAERLRSSNRYAALAGFERLRNDYLLAKEALSESVGLLSSHLDSQFEAYREQQALGREE